MSGPPSQEPGAYYAVLGLDAKATKDDVRAAYKERALWFHPDKNPKGEAAFKAVAAAYQVLNDPKQRAQYDAEYRAYLSRQRSAAASGGTTTTASGAAGPRMYKPPPRRSYEEERRADDDIMRDAFRDYPGASSSSSTAAGASAYQRRTEAGGAAGSAFRHAWRRRAPDGDGTTSSSNPGPTPPPRSSQPRRAPPPDEEAEAPPPPPPRYNWQSPKDLARDREAEARRQVERERREKLAAEARAEAERLRRDAAEARERFLKEAAARRKAREEADARLQQQRHEATAVRRAEAIAETARRCGVAAAEVEAATAPFVQAVTRWDLASAARHFTASAPVAPGLPFEHPQLGDGTTALHVFAAFAYKRATSAPEGVIDDLLQTLLRVDGSVGVRDGLGRTPLHLAAANGGMRLVKAVLETIQSADSASTHTLRAALSLGDTDTGATPLDYAATNGNLNAIDLLLAAGADPNGPPDRKKRSPLHAAVRFGHATAAAALVRAGANVDLRDVMRFTPLHFAAQECDADSVRLLLRAGADRTVTTPSGETPLMLAEEAATRARGALAASCRQCIELLKSAP